MTKKKSDISPPMPKSIRLDGGRLWHRKESGGPGYSTDDCNYDILCGNGYVVLVSFIHAPIDDCEFWRKRFRTAKEAMEYAEKM